MFTTPISSKIIQNFVVDSGLNEDKLNQLMYPPRPQRSTKVQKQIFDSSSSHHSFVKGLKKDSQQNFSKKIFTPFKLTKHSQKQRNCKNWDSEIERFFKTFRETKCSLDHQKYHFIETDLRNFILFQPILKDSLSAKLCLTFYSLVKKYGSFLDVLAFNKLSIVIKQLQDIVMIKEDDFVSQIYFEIYKKHILAYEMYKAHKLQMMQPVNIDQVKYYTMQEVDKIIKSKRQDVQFNNKDVFVMQKFSQYVEFDESLISVQYFNKHYGDKIFDTRIQRSDAYGFDVFTSFMNNDQQQMKASDYFEYQKLQGTPQVKSLPIYKRLKKNQVCFAVNVELIGKQEIQRQIHNKLQKVKYVQYINQFDALSYCEKWIPGCNHPQLYFKVKGVWTGGHQQNVCMSSVNVNFGPDDSQWFTIAIEHVPRLRKQIIQQFGVDIIEHQGLWFAPPEWMIVNNYPVKKLIQKKGDLVYSGPGTLHWVRSLGKCLHASWNLFPKTTKQWRQAVARTEINQQINFHQIFMPLKSLAIKLLNHEYQTRTSFIATVERSLRVWFIQQLQDVQNFQQKNGQIQNIKYRCISDLESLCENCRSQILTIYTLDDDKQTVCFKCYSKMTRGQRRSLYIKHNPQNIAKLLSRIQRLRELKQPIQNIDQTQVLALCSKVYCGVVNCSFNPNQRSSQKDHKIKNSNQMKNQSQSFSHVQVQSKPSQMFEMREIHIPHEHIDSNYILQLLADQMPKCSWNSTEQVLQIQAKIIRQKCHLLPYFINSNQNKNSIEIVQHSANEFVQ